MKANISTITTLLRTDRLMAVLLVLLVAVGVAFAVYTAVTVEPSDLQVATRYTSFGGTHFYRNKWYYLLSFGIFGLIVTVLHAAVALKLYSRDQRQLAILLMVFSFFLVIIAWITVRSVFRVAFL